MGFVPVGTGGSVAPAGQASNLPDAEAGGEDDAKQLIAAARAAGAEWVVVDGYHFGDAYQKAVVEAGLRLLVIDDFGHAADYWAHLVLNQNFDAPGRDYGRRRGYTRLLLGPPYVLLRREFAAWRTFQRSIPPQAKRLLVTCGGSDPGNTTPKVVEALARTGLKDLEAAVILGGDNPHSGRIRAVAEKAPCAIAVRQNVQDMAEVMAWADMAIIVAGTALWELDFMGCPTMSFGRGALPRADHARPGKSGPDTILGLRRSRGTGGTGGGNHAPGRRRSAAPGNVVRGAETGRRPGRGPRRRAMREYRE